MGLNLGRTTWQELVEHLHDLDAINSEDDARTDYIGPGQPDHCISFTVSGEQGAPYRLAAALTEAFTVIPGLVELTADGFGIYELLRDARTTYLGGETVVYFPGHKAQQ